VTRSCGKCAGITAEGNFTPETAYESESVSSRTGNFERRVSAKNLDVESEVVFEEIEPGYLRHRRVYYND
jgi:hypothetical protein